MTWENPVRLYVLELYGITTTGTIFSSTLKSKGDHSSPSEWIGSSNLHRIIRYDLLRQHQPKLPKETLELTDSPSVSDDMISGISSIQMKKNQLSHRLDLLCSCLEDLILDKFISERAFHTLDGSLEVVRDEEEESLSYLSFLSPTTAKAFQLAMKEALKTKIGEFLPEPLAMIYNKIIEIRTDVENMKALRDAAVPNIRKIIFGVSRASMRERALSTNAEKRRIAGELKKHEKELEKHVKEIETLLASRKEEETVVAGEERGALVTGMMSSPSSPHSADGRNNVPASMSGPLGIIMPTGSGLL